MPNVNAQDLSNDFKKLSGLTRSDKSIALKALHGKVAALGAIHFIFDFADQNSIPLDKNWLQALGTTRDTLKEYFQGAWLGAGGRVEVMNPRFYCDLMIGYNVQWNIYKDKYSGATLPKKMELKDLCGNAMPNQQELIRIRGIVRGVH